jgi:hypothetical protein
VETLGEVGIVGLALLAAALALALGGALLRIGRGDPDRFMWAAVAAAIVTWLLEAGVDWVWQMPAATAWVFALGGAALARQDGPVRAAGRAATSSTVRLVAGLALLLVAVTPVRVVLSQNSLGKSIDAVGRGDCRTGVEEAIAASQALGARAEPFELLAYCNARLGLGPLAERMARRAIARDPANWEYHYDLALVRAAAGNDPREAIREARRLNPLSGMLHTFGEQMATSDPRTWRRRAAEARLLLPPR